jgi:hypothetical protein
MLVLPNRCLQLILEDVAANPFASMNDTCLLCGVGCSFCLGDYPRIFPRIRHLGVERVLLGIFVGQYPIQGRPAVDDALVTAIQKFPEVQSIIFGMDRSRKSPEPQLIKKLILMLLAARILDMYIETTEPTSTTDNVKLVVLC